MVDSPANPAQFQLTPRAAAGIARLNQSGLPVVVVSNQPGIAKGKLVPRLLDSITARMRETLAAGGATVDGVYYCLHHPDARLKRGQAGVRMPEAEAGPARARRRGDGFRSRAIVHGGGRRHRRPGRTPRRVPHDLGLAR